MWSEVNRLPPGAVTLTPHGMTFRVPNTPEGRVNLTEMEWPMWLSDNGEQFFGQDFYEFGNIGTQPSMRCLSHLRGLQLAAKQLGEER